MRHFVQVATVQVGGGTAHVPPAAFTNIGAIVSPYAVVVLVNGAELVREMVEQRVTFKKGHVQLLMELHFNSYGVSLAMWDHTVLPGTRHK